MKLNLRLTHKANDAFREILGDVLATTLEPFCRERKVEVVYDLSPDDVPLGSLHAALANHSATGRTGKALDRIKKKVGDFMGEHAIEAVSEVLAPLTKIVVAPEAPADMSDVLDAVNALGEEDEGLFDAMGGPLHGAPCIGEEPVTEEADEDAAMSAPDAPAPVVAPVAMTVQKKIASMSLVPKIRAADRLANLYKDLKKAK